MKDAKLIVIQADKQRIGQKIVNFLIWLDEIKGKEPFYIKDNKMIEYWEEFNK